MTLVAGVFLLLAVGVHVALEGVRLKEFGLALTALVHHVITVHLRVHDQLVGVKENPQANVAREHFRLSRVGCCLLFRFPTFPSS